VNGNDLNMVVLYHDFFLVVYITYLAYAVFCKNKN